MTLFVAQEGALTSFDIETGAERPGAVQDLVSPVDMQILEDGTVLVNLTGRNEILVVDGHTMLETRRIPSSDGAGARPVHSYISPTHGGRRYWLSLNDGTSGIPATNSARFVDVTPGSPTYLSAVAELPLGVGHHKAGFSSTRERVVISNIADCDNAMSVYDYSDLNDIKTLLTISAADLGWDGVNRKCDPTFQNGFPPAPHGCDTAKVNGKVYCNVTSTGQVVSVEIDASPPTFTIIQTTGSGGGKTHVHPDGRHVYTLQENPREASASAPGATCQIGQLVVIDATHDTVTSSLPLLYKGPHCTDALAGTDEASANAGHLTFTSDAKTLFIGTAGGFGNAAARVRYQLAADTTQPATPVQLPSIRTGDGTSHRAEVLSSDGRFLFVANNGENSVSQIDALTREEVRKIPVSSRPNGLATFGSAEGPSKHTGPIH